MLNRFEGLSKTSDKSTHLSEQSESPANLTQLRAVHHRFRDPQTGSHEMLRLRGGAGDSWESFLDEAQQAIDEVSQYQRQRQQDYVKHKMGDRYTLYQSYRSNRDRSTEATKANNERQRHERLFGRIKNLEGENELLENTAKYLSKSSASQKADRGEGSRSQPYEQQEVAASSDSGDSDSQQHGEGSSSQQHDQAGSSQQPIATANEDNRAWTEFLETTKKVDESCKDWRNFWGQSD